MESISTDIARWLIAIGLFLVAAGLLFYLFGDRLGWLGNLPGDIRIEKDNFRFYFPITTMILLSIFLSILVTLAGKIIR